MVEKEKFLDFLADIIETNCIHTLSFELRRRNLNERRELVEFLRSQSKEI